MNLILKNRNTPTPPTKLYEIISVLISFFLGVVLFCDQNWEPSSETYKHWVNSQIFINDFKFNTNSGPLYILYLTFLYNTFNFLFFNFTLAFIFDKFFYVLFFSSSLYFISKNYLPKIICVIFITAWIPYIWTIESTARVLAVGFVGIYFFRYNYLKETNKYSLVPLSLLTASLIDKFAFLFLIAHIFFFFTQKINYYTINKLKLLIKIFLFSLIVFSTIYKSDIKEANYMSIDYKFAPINLNDGAYNGVFFQVGTWRWIKREFYIKKKLDEIEKEQDLYKADWYFYTDRAFNNSNKFYETIYKAPKALLLNIFRNFKDGLDISSNFIVGYSQEPSRMLTIITTLLSCISFISLFIKNYRNKKALAFYTLYSGTFILFVALLPIFFNYRYNIIFFISFFLITLNVISSLFYFNYFFLKKKKIKIKFFNLRIYINFFILLILSLFFLLKLNSFFYFILISFLTIFFIIYNLIFIFKNIYKLKKTHEIYLPIKIRIINYIFILIISLSIFFNNKFFFEDKTFVNLNLKIFQLAENSLPLINFFKKQNLANKLILIPEPQIIVALGFVSITEIKPIYFLPPFYDKDTASMLNNFDFILLPYHYFEGPFVEQSTQGYLRYKLYLENFLKEKLNNNQIVKIEIKNYGYAFLKKN